MEGPRQTPVRIDLDESSEQFSAAVWERGERYAAAGRVLSIRVRGSDLIAQVKGSHRWTYEVSLQVEDRRVVRGACSCPFNDWCKHMAAVAIAAAAQTVDTEPEPTEDNVVETPDHQLRLYLEGLDRDDLLDWLVEYAREEDDLRRRLVELSSPDDQVPAIIRDIRKRIRSAWGGRGSVISHHASRDVGHEIGSVRESIARLADRGRKREAADLLERLVESGKKHIERVDDSSGFVSTEIRFAVDQWGATWGEIEDRDPIALARLVLAHQANDDYGLTDSVIASFSQALGTEGLKELRRLWLEKLDSIHVSEGDEKGWSEQRFERSRTCAYLRDIADGLGEVDDYIDVCRREGSLESYAPKIARRLLDADRPQEALEYLDRHAPRDRLRHGQEDLPDLRSDVLLALNRREESLETLWTAFRRTLSRGYMSRALRLTPKTDRKRLEEEALAVADRFPEALTALCFFAETGNLDRASALIERRFPEISGESYLWLREIAEALSQAHPKQAWQLYRLMVADVLDERRSRAYPAAVTYVKKMAMLASRGDFSPEHSTFLQDLRARHGRKYSFWNRVDGKER